MSSIMILQAQAQIADDRFAAELSRVYGKRACEARYQSEHADSQVRAAACAKLIADQKVRAALESQRRR